jgi:hypothetical protein
VPPQLVVRASSQALPTHPTGLHSDGARPVGQQADGVTPDAEREPR